MTDLERLGTADTLMSVDNETFSKTVEKMSVEELEDLGLLFSTTAKVSSLRVGYIAYQIRLKTPDGAWGQEKYKMAATWDVSDRTIQRWMATAQEHFGFELTAAQKNSQIPSNADSRLEDKPSSTDDLWSDEDDDLANAGFTEEHIDGEGGFFGWSTEAGKDVWIPYAEGEEPDDITDNRKAFNDLIGEPWAERDSVTPSPEYINKLPTTSTPTPLALEPDATWIAFTISQLQTEHPAYGEEAARRSAVARWARQITDTPLDLLEELEMIHGGSLPDETVAKLHEAEENKVLKPDAVTEGGKTKKPRGTAGPKSLEKVAEKLMELAREIHGRIHAGEQEGTVSDAEIAQMATSIMGAAHTIDGLKKRVNQAKDRLKKAESSASSGEF